MPMDYKYDPSIQPNDARAEPSTSWGEILDRSSQMLFMTEIFRGFWWVGLPPLGQPPLIPIPWTADRDR